MKQVPAWEDMDDLQRSIWTAGWLEGEGCYSTAGGGAGCPGVAGSCTDLDVLQRVADVLGAKPPVPSMRKNRPVHHKQAYQFWLYGEAAAKAMRAVLPAMGHRRTAKILEVLARAAARPRGFYRAVSIRAERRRAHDTRTGAIES